MPKMKWGLTGDPGEIEGNIYDGPTPPKGLYICAVKRLGVKTNRNGDLMLNGLLEIRDPRKGKSKFNGYGFWFNRNVTEQGAKYVKNFIANGLGVPMKGLESLDSLIVLDDKEPPANIVSVGKVKIDKEPLIVVAAKRRRQNDDPEGEWELTTDDFAPAFPGIDPKKLIAKAGADDDDEDDDDEDADDDDEMDDPFDEDDEEDEDEEDEDEDEDDLTREELSQMGLAELRELAVENKLASKARAAKLKKTELVDLLAPEDEEDEEEDEEEEEAPPPPKKTTRKVAGRTKRK